MGGIGSGTTPKEPRTAVGKLVRSSRVRMNRPSGEVARSMGFSPQYLSHVELGVTPMSFGHMKLFMSELNINREELFEALSEDLLSKFLGAINEHY